MDDSLEHSMDKLEISGSGGHFFVLFLYICIFFFLRRAGSVVNLLVDVFFGVIFGKQLCSFVTSV